MAFRKNDSLETRHSRFSIEGRRTAFRRRRISREARGAPREAHPAGTERETRCDEKRDRGIRPLIRRALFVILFAFASNGIYPFGDVSVMMYDMPVQYAQFFGWLSNVINGDASLLYSADAGMGCGTYAQYTYYLSSPLNALVAFCDPSQVPYFFSFLFLAKIPLAAVTCLAFLRGRFAAAGAKGSCATQVLAVVGAIAYSLTSYVTGYSSNIMWIDGVIMAPLACLGVYRLVRGRGCAALFASCACAILFNWYTGYMVCFFTIFYFFYEYARLRIEERERACD